MSKANFKNMEAFAAACGISRPTISKYFNDPNSVRQSTRERIEKAVKQYNFRPNIFAMDQNRAKTRNIGIIVPFLSDPVFGEIARNLERRCIEKGFRPTLFSAHGKQEHEVEALERLEALRPAGVLLAPLGRRSNREVLAQFCSQIPTVLFDRNITDIGEAFVGSDNMSFVSQSIDYLKRMGEVPCFFEMKNPSNPNSIARRELYIQLMEEEGLEPILIQIEGEGWDLEEIAYNGATELLQKGSLPTKSVLCSNDRLAFGLLAACYKNGLRVGRQDDCALRVVGIDDHPFSRYTCPSLTTIGHDYDAVSASGVDTLFDLIEVGGRFEKRLETTFPNRLVLRDSA